MGNNANGSLVLSLFSMLNMVAHVICYAIYVYPTSKSQIDENMKASLICFIAHILAVQVYTATHKPQSYFSFHVWHSTVILIWWPRLQLQSDAGRKRGEGRWKCGGDDWGIISLSQFLIICAHQQILNLSILWVLTHWGQCSKLVNLPQTCCPPLPPPPHLAPQNTFPVTPPPLQDKKGKILQVACCNADLNVRLSVSGNEWRFQINETHPDFNLSQRAVSWCVPVKTSAQIKLMFMLQ